MRDAVGPTRTKTVTHPSTNRARRGLTLEDLAKATGNITRKFGEMWTVVFIARRYASAVYAMALCQSVSLSVCLSVSLSQVGVLLKPVKRRITQQHHTIAQGI